MRVKTAITFVLLCWFGLGCGGGGGGGGGGGRRDPLKSLPYTGMTSPASITAENAEDVTSEAYFGPSTEEAARRREEGVGARASSALRSLPRQVVRLAPRASSTTPKQRSIQDSVPGDCGGWAHLDLTYDDETGRFHGTGTYEAYDDCNGQWTGPVKLSGRFDLLTFDYEEFNLSYELMQSTDLLGHSYTMSGRSESTFDGMTEITDHDERIRDESSKKVYWFSGVRVTATLGYDLEEGRDYVDEGFLSGRFYDPDRGYVELSTEISVRTYVGDKRPVSGVFTTGGAAGTKAWLDFVSPDTYRVTADTDGNGVPDFDTGEKSYPPDE